MIHGVAERPRGPRWRRAAAPIGLVLAVAASVPDLARLASGSEVAQTLWYALAATFVPALVALGAPWSSLPLLSALGARLERRAALRSERPRLAPAVGVLVLDLAVVVCWRTPVFVGAVAHHPALVLAQSASLGLAGVALWLELVATATASCQPHPVRAALAAITMWTIWILAYLDAMSSTGWYHAYRHVAGAGLSASADRQLADALLWAVAAVAFLPVIYVQLFRWLRAEAERGGDGREAAARLAGP